MTVLHVLSLQLLWGEWACGGFSDVTSKSAPVPGALPDSGVPLAWVAHAEVPELALWGCRGTGSSPLADAA